MWDDPLDMVLRVFPVVSQRGGWMMSYSDVLEGSLLWEIPRHSSEAKGERGSGELGDLCPSEDASPSDETEWWGRT